jgi:seryl-tRNA synthetase
VETETLQATINTASKEIGLLIGKGEKENAEKKRAEVSSLKDKLSVLKGDLIVSEETLKNELLKLPNLPNSSVPKGKTPEENELVREAGIKPVLAANAVPHWDLIKQYGLVDFETGAKLPAAAFHCIKARAQNYKGR